jgi:hypothetical protein
MSPFISSTPQIRVIFEIIVVFTRTQKRYNTIRRHAKDVDVRKLMLRHQNVHQVEREVKKLSSPLDIRVVCVEITPTSFQFFSGQTTSVFLPRHENQNQ